MSTILNFEKWSSLKESLLNEGIDLSKDVNLKKAFQVIKAKIAKGDKQPTAVMGQYLLKFTEPQNFESAVQVTGKVLAFQSMPWKGIGNLPCLPDYTTGFGGTFQWKLTEDVPYSIEMDYTIPQFADNLTAGQVISTINQTMANIPVETLKTMYNSHPNKVKYDAAIAAFKASAPGKQVLAGLTGNAKAFYGV